MNYGTLIDNQLHPAPRAVRAGGAVLYFDNGFCKGSPKTE